MIKNDDEYFPLYILDAHTFLLSRAPVLDLNLKTMYPNKLSNYTVTKKVTRQAKQIPHSVLNLSGIIPSLRILIK